MSEEKVKELLFESAPHLIDEWDYDKNRQLDPDRLVIGSSKSAWWLCSNGHSWKTQIRVRAKYGNGCSKCFLAKKAEENPLRPDLADQLDDPRYSASDLSQGTRKIVWWKCKEGHRWESPVANRVYGNTGCPYCSGRFPVAGETDLATLRPDLVSEWDDESFSPSDFTLSSMQKIRWKCANGHKWTTRIHYRTHSRTKGSGCPYCPGSRGKHAKILVGVNDLGTLHPEIASELDSTEITAQELREFSNKKVPWKCSQGHKWITMVSTRVVYGSGCPDCALIRTSKIEGRLRTLVSTQDYLSGTILDSGHKLMVPFRKNKSMSVDIYCEWGDLPVVVEYDGSFWHHSEASRKRDLDKTNALLEHGYLVIRVRENQLPLLDIDHQNLFQMNVQYSSNEDVHLEAAIKDIEQWLNNRITTCE